jgi:hypothetical protein
MGASGGRAYTFVERGRSSGSGFIHFQRAEQVFFEDEGSDLRLPAVRPADQPDKAFLRGAHAIVRAGFGFAVRVGVIAADDRTAGSPQGPQQLDVLRRIDFEAIRRKIVRGMDRGDDGAIIFENAFDQAAALIWERDVCCFFNLYPQRQWQIERHHHHRYFALCGVIWPTRRPSSVLKINTRFPPGSCTSMIKRLAATCIDRIFDPAGSP